MSASSKIISKDGEVMLSTKKVAQRLSCAPDYVGILCREGKLEGKRVDNVWFVKESSIAAFESARKEARAIRSQELAAERQKEQQTYKKNNTPTTPVVVTKTPEPAVASVVAPAVFPVVATTTPRARVRSLPRASSRTSVAFALGGMLLFASLVFAGQVVGPQANPFSLTASVAPSVKSPFFSAPPSVSLDGTPVTGNLFSSVFAFLFGGHAATVATAPSGSTQGTTPATLPASTLALSDAAPAAPQPEEAPAQQPAISPAATL